MCIPNFIQILYEHRHIVLNFSQQFKSNILIYLVYMKIAYVITTTKPKPGFKNISIKEVILKEYSKCQVHQF